MSDIKTLQGQLEDNTLRLNAARYRIRDLKQLLDFPHNQRNVVNKLTAQIAEMEVSLANLKEQQVKALQLLDADYLENELREAYSVANKLDEARGDLVSQIGIAQQDAKVQPTLNKLETQLEALKKLPVEQLRDIIANLTKGLPNGKQTGEHDTTATTVDAATSGSGG